MKRSGLLIALALAGCSNEDGARHALTAEGYTHVTTTGWSMFGCSDSDSTCTGFDAIGPTGVHVTGVVGCGYWTKGCTLRIK